VERPGGLACSLVARTHDPLADAPQFFQGDTAFGALGDSNNSLGDLVVDLGGVPRLAAGTLPEELLGTFGLPGLEFGLLTGLPPAVAAQTATGVVVPVGGGGEVVDAPVHPR
jgi:hypothetical protein